MRNEFSFILSAETLQDCNTIFATVGRGGVRIICFLIKTQVNIEMTLKSIKINFLKVVLVRFLLYSRDTCCWSNSTVWKSHQKFHFHNSLLHPHEINPITCKSKFIYITLITPKKYVLETFAYVCGNITSKFDV